MKQSSQMEYKDQIIKAIADEILHRDDRLPNAIETPSRIFLYVTDIPEAIGYQSFESGIETILELIGLDRKFVNVEPEVRQGKDGCRNASVTIGITEQPVPTPKTSYEMKPDMKMQERTIPVPTKEEEEQIAQRKAPELNKEITSDIASAGDFFGD